jgi:hypothetical protein
MIGLLVGGNKMFHWTPDTFTQQIPQLSKEAIQIYHVLCESIEYDDLRQNFVTFPYRPRKIFTRLGLGRKAGQAGVDELEKAGVVEVRGGKISIKW